MLTPKETVLNLMFFAQLLKNGVENAQNVFGDMKLVPQLENALKLFAQPDTFQTIMENVLRWATFVKLMMLTEFVWPVSQLTLLAQAEFAYNFKHQTHVQTDNIWVMITSATRSVISVMSTILPMESVLNVSTVITSCTLENVSFKRIVNQDKFWLTTTVMMSAQPVETSTEPPESVLTVFLTIMNFIMDFVFQLKLVVPDNGLITTEFATMLILNATHSTHQQVLVQAASKDTTTLTESAVLKVNTTWMVNVSLPQAPMLL